MSNTETKVCKKCGVEKGVREYYKTTVAGKEYLKGMCKRCESNMQSTRMKAQYHNDFEYREQNKKKTIEYRRNNKEKVVQRKRDCIKKIVNDLTDSYVKMVLIQHAKGLKPNDIPPHLVEQKRQQLIAKREARANKNK